MKSNQTTKTIEQLQYERDLLREALENMMGVYDTPISRLKYKPSDFMWECIKSGRDALAKTSKT